MKIYYNGTDLTDGYIVSNVVRPLIMREPELLDVPGMDGAVLGLADLQPATVTMDITVPGDPATREPHLRALAALLYSGPAALEFEDEGHTLTAVASAPTINRYPDAAVLEDVTFTAADPVMRGKSKTATMASSSESILVGGNYPTKPTITCASATNSGGGVWGIRIDGGPVAYVELSAAGVSVEIDSEARTVTDAGNTALLTLASDWPVLAPGSHTVTLEGTGYPTIAWTERWI